VPSIVKALGNAVPTSCHCVPSQIRIILAII
jgi:hypothetical protein